MRVKKSEIVPDEWADEIDDKEVFDEIEEVMSEQEEDDG